MFVIMHTRLSRLLFNLLRITGGWLLGVMLGVSAARAQSSLSGTVLDSVTRQPLAFGTVFLANTTLGVTTGEAGQFTFPQVPAGTYEVVASYIGYSLRRQQVTVARAPQQLTFRLPPAANSLGEVVIRPRPNRPEDYQKFVESFLGSTTFSAQCRIRNPAAVRVEYDAERNELTATCDEFLTVENRALGYRIRYYGLDFRQNFAEGWIAYYGSPVFEPLATRSGRQQRRWAANRQQAYRGSLPHFLRSAHDNRVAEEGFRVQRLRRRPHPGRARADSLLALMRAQPYEARVVDDRTFSDSLQRLSRVPRQVEYLFTQPLTAPDFSQRPPATAGVQLAFPDLLLVEYAQEPADPAYVAFTARQAAPGQTLPAGLGKQSSVLHLLRPQVPLQPNGLPENPLDLVTEGYWGFEKMGEFLPVDYWLPASAVQSGNTR